ncbi:MAG: hypothetical protein V3U49_01240 [Nitrososphaerales archaeon]
MSTKYADLLNDKDVKRWYENLLARSDLTATVYLRSLGLFCSLNKTSPKKILDQSSTKRFRDNFTDFVRKQEREGKAGSYIARFKKVIISWLAYNNVSLKLKVNIKGESDTPTIADERVPTKEELARIIRLASPRGRVSIALMAFSSLRPESLGDYFGKDGLKLGDLRDVEIEPKSIEFKKIPAMLVIRKNLSKARFQYFTFIPEEGLIYIREYLDGRIRGGERLDDKTPLLYFDGRGNRKNEFLRTILITRDIKEAILAAHFSWRPYVLRAYSATALDIAESRGLISHSWRQFFMGHKGDIEARYSTAKRRLPPDMIDEMRTSYSRCEPLLISTAPPIDKPSVAKEAQIQAIRSIAKSLYGIDSMDIKIAKERESGREISLDEEIVMMENELKKFRTQGNGSKDHKVILESDLLSHLDEGWQIIREMNDSGKFLLRRG